MSTTTTSPPQLSRYRSVRQPAKPLIPNGEQAQSAVPPMPQSHASASTASTSSRENVAMERSKSMSRYHNRNAQGSGFSPTSGTTSRYPNSTTCPPMSPPMSPPMDLITRSRSVGIPHRQPSRYNKSTSPPLPTMSPPLNTSSGHGGVLQRHLSGSSYPSTAQSPRSNRSSHVVSPQASAFDFLEREKARLDKMRIHQQEDQRKNRLQKQLKQAEVDKVQAQKNEEEKAKKAKDKEEALVAQAAKDEADLWRAKRKDEAEKKKMREKMDKLRAKAEAVDEPISHPQIFEKLGLFRRRITPPDTGSDSFESFQPQTSAGRGEKQIIKPGGGGIVPLSDAPVSAVNHGDRRVRIVTQGKSVLLPIKNTTTPLQLIRSCVTFFDAPIDPRNSLLIEDFTKCGIQRNLRMYEHIRNVLNSWDSDDQHTLSLVPYESSQDSKLYATWAPKLRPSGGKWTLYLSQERGKWEKRFITMTHDGQISAAKNEEGKGQTNICHLSDFDVYRLSRDGEKKKIKPPKKFCYAVKSLRKSSMFLGDTGFIHVFCSSDAAVAQNFHDTIYRWRCWYLVNIMGEDGQGKAPLTRNAAASDGPLLSSDDFDEDKRAYVLGSFNNDLKLDFQTFEVKEEVKPKGHTRLPSDTPLASAIAVGTKNDVGLMSASEHSKAVNSRQQTIRRAAQSNPPVSMHNAHNAAHQRNMSNNTSSQPNTSTQHNGTPQSNGLSRSASTRSTNRRSVERNQSTRQRKDSTINNHNNNNAAKTTAQAPLAGLMPRPLIDLTPAYVEPPQHRNKGRGIAASQVDGPLVESATTQREPGAIVVPDSVNWHGGAGGLLARATSVKKTQQSDTSNKRNSANLNDSSAGGGGPGRGLLGELPGNEGFTGSGLLAPHVSKT